MWITPELVGASQLLKSQLPCTALWHLSAFMHHIHMLPGQHQQSQRWARNASSSSSSSSSASCSRAQHTSSHTAVGQQQQQHPEPSESSGPSTNASSPPAHALHVFRQQHSHPHLSSPANSQSAVTQSSSDILSGRHPATAAEASQPFSISPFSQSKRQQPAATATNSIAQQQHQQQPAIAAADVASNSKSGLLQQAAVPAATHASTSSSSISSSSSPFAKQSPPAPGTPARPALSAQHHGRHLASQHLRQYLASISSSSFVEDLAAGIKAGNRLAISRALTLCESTRPDHALQAAALLRKLIDDSQQQQQQQLLGAASSRGSADSTGQVLGSVDGAVGESGGGSLAGGQQQQQQWQQQQQPLLPAAAAAAAAADTPSSISKRRSGTLRVGLSGPPGAGKSSLIETWGGYLADHGSRVAVLAVDPSSVESGGAILGDKTRMARLSSHPNAYVRPSPARGTLGGVSRATYDAMLICEAAGYDRLLVETVGVGQSEVAVADLVDCMMLVMPPVGGDDLQMIKRGIMEVADIVAVNKADGDTEKAATRAAGEYSGCVRLMPHRYRGWEPQVLAVSAHSGKGVPELARLVTQFQDVLTASGELQKCRVQRAEAVAWLSLEEQLLEGLRQDPHVRWLLGRLMPCVRSGSMAPRSAADIALSYFYQHCG